jgi:hypothetical protein
MALAYSPARNAATTSADAPTGGRACAEAAVVRTSKTIETSDMTAHYNVRAMAKSSSFRVDTQLPQAHLR